VFHLLSLEGWISFISIISVWIIGYTFSLRLIYESIKRQVKLLFFAGIMIIFMTLVYLGPFFDFLTIFLTGSNFPNKEILAILSHVWNGPISISVAYILSELIIPKYKKYILVYSFLLGALLEVFLFLDPLGSIRVILSQDPGEIAHFPPMVIGSPFFIIQSIIFVSFPLFLIGLIYKVIQLKGILKKKYTFLTIAFSLYITSMALFTFLPSAILFTILNVLVFISYCFLYLGLREEREKPKEKTPKKEVKIEESLFRLTKRPDNITEEDVTFHREKKICLVCKGDVSRINYICPNCSALYCIKCSEELTKLENVCWVCNEPFDPSKPSKPYKKEEEEVEIDKSEKIQKKSKVDNNPSQNK